MPLFRRTLDQIKALLAGLTVSQKMLIATLVVIIVGSVVWMMNYAARPERVAVINQQFEPTVLARQSAALKAAGIATQVKDGRVWVTQSEQEQALAVLAFSGDLAGQDISFGFEKVVNDSNIWRTESDRDRMWKVATENELARVLKLMPGVQDAKVIVDRPNRLSFDHPSDAAGSAAIHLRLNPGAAIDKKMILAAADLISGAVREIPRERVRLVDTTNGRSYRVPSEDSAIPADLLDLTLLHEKHLTDNILKAIGAIDNVLISVSVKVDPAGKTTQAVTPDKASAITPLLTESTSKTTGGDGGGGEPGVMTNTSVSVPTGSAGRGGHSQTEEKTTYGTPVFATTTTTTTEPAGTVKEVSAAVNIPRSYFVAALKTATGQDGDAAALKQFIADQTEQIKEKVLRAIGLPKADEGKVAIGWYYDQPPAAAPDTQPAKAAGMVALVTDHASTIGLGALAVTSLLVMLMMMRKAASGATIAPPEPAMAEVNPMPMAPVPSLASAASEPAVDSFVSTMKPDEDVQRNQKMVEQVAVMVKQNPDAAASLVKRWISKKQK